MGSFVFFVFSLFLEAFLFFDMDFVFDLSRQYIHHNTTIKEIYDIYSWFTLNQS